jgi:hypothetical protein
MRFLDYTATLLPDGRVLITGGIGAGATGNVSLNSTEIYDPSTGVFSPAASMYAARNEHSATLLSNGKVLIAGGDGVNGGTAELYDPTTGKFSSTGNMVADGSYKHIAALLQDGKVLFVAAGYHGYGAQIYDPVSGVFTPTGNPLAAPYGSVTSTPLVDGRVLVTQFSETLGELYGPAEGSFSRTNSVQIPWVQGAAVQLLNGQVLLCAGNPDYDAVTEAELFTPYDVQAPPPPKDGFNGGPDGFIQTGNMTVARGEPSATLLPDGKVLVAGGFVNYEGLPGEVWGSSELYDPRTQMFTPTGDMAAARAYHTSTLLNSGRVLVTGGLIGNVAAGSGAELYTPESVVLPPSLFTLTGANSGRGAIWHSATGALVSAVNPAVAGEALSMYTSNLANGGVIPPQVIVGDRPANILYFGSAPGYPDYDQVNFQAPADVTAGSDVPVRLIYLGRSSNQVSIAVQ